VLDETTGGYVQMPAVAQRVMMLISFAETTEDFNYPQAHNRVKKRIEGALTVMVDAKEIEILSIEVGSDEKGKQYRRVNYKDLTAGGLDQTVQLA
jgi:hypothetical protein